MPEEALAPRRMELKVTRGKLFSSKTELEWRFLLRGAARSHVFFPDARRGEAPPPRRAPGSGLVRARARPGRRDVPTTALFDGAHGAGQRRDQQEHSRPRDQIKDHGVAGGGINGRHRRFLARLTPKAASHSARVHVIQGSVRRRSVSSVRDDSAESPRGHYDARYDDYYD